jgi:hypothetical protein
MISTCSRFSFSRNNKSSDGYLLREHEGGWSFGARVKFVGDTDGDGIVDYAVSDVYLSDATTTEPGSVTLFSGHTGKQLLSL